MISLTSLQFFINAALEAGAVVFSGIILGSCIVRKSRTRKKHAFCMFTLFLILLLICNLTTWVLDGMFVTPTFLPKLYTLDLVLTVFDYFFYCLVGVMMYRYVMIIIYDLQKRNDPPEKIPHFKLLLVLSMISTGIFASSMYTGWFYSFPEDGYTYYTSAYWVLVAFSTFAIWLIAYNVIKNRELLGKRRMLLLLAYSIIPLLLIVVDQLFSLSFSYISLSLISTLIYMDVDIEQEQTMLKQEAMIALNEAEKNEMKLNLMMSQIQPHFLYNSLSTISYLCRVNPKDAEETVNDFSDYLAGNLNSINSKRPVPFEKELGHTKSYLKIQKRRFNERMQIEYDIEVKNFEIPALTLQPLVENAVRHGVEQRLDATIIRISTNETEDSYIVKIEDNGPGFDVNAKPSGDRPHIGINATRSRLTNMVNGRLDISSEIGRGTLAIVTIPKKPEVDK